MLKVFVYKYSTSALNASGFTKELLKINCSLYLHLPFLQVNTMITIKERKSR